MADEHGRGGSTLLTIPLETITVNLDVHLELPPEFISEQFRKLYEIMLTDVCDNVSREYLRGYLGRYALGEDFEHDEPKEDDSLGDLLLRAAAMLGTDHAARGEARLQAILDEGPR